jgi:5,10-methylenetetrahydrofolate reductase
VPRREKSLLARAFARQQFVVVAEVDAPRGVRLDAPVALARRMRALGATAVNVPSYPQSGARSGALPLAVLIEQAQVETLLHYTCRDRSLLGMQADLVGAHALGLRNLLLTTGAPVQQGGYADAASTVEVDAIGLLNMISRLNHGLDIAGQPIGAPTAFHAGATVNPFAANPEAEWQRLAHKVDAGAEFLVTPPVLDLEAFDAALPALRATGLPILAGVAALDGLRHVEFLASEVVGVRVADASLARLRRAADEAAEALRITLEIVQGLRGHVAGIQITGFHGSPAAVERLLASLGALLEETGPMREAQHG